jgi:hypothetical protein
MLACLEIRAQKARMKHIHVMIMSGGKAIDAEPLNAVEILRLMAFAKMNKVGLAEMVRLAINFAIAPEDRGPKMVCPNEEDIVVFAAGLLQKIPVKGKR